MNWLWTAALVLVAGILVFRRAGKDYARLGRLRRSTSTLQVLVFVLHGVASLILLDSRPGAIDTASPLFGLALLLIAGGLILLASTMGRFGMSRAVGQETSGLTCSGMYRRSRNPQVMFYGIAVVGYMLLWPSWSGALWVVLYAILAQVMVKTEEAHLKRAYASEYVEYCEHTPRYIDLPGMK